MDLHAKIYHIIGSIKNERRPAIADPLGTSVASVVTSDRQQPASQQGTSDIEWLLKNKFLDFYNKSYLYFDDIYG